MAAFSRRDVCVGEIAEAGVAWLVCVVLLAGCGGGGSSGPTPTPIPTGTPVAQPFVIDGGASSDTTSSIAWSGSVFLVAYGVSPSGSPTAIRGALVSDGGGPSGSPFVVSVPSSMPFLTDATVSSPSVAWDGSNFVVVWFASGTATQGPLGQTISTVQVSSGGSVAAPSADIAQQVSFGMCQSALAAPPAAAATPLVAMWPLQGGCINTPVITEPNGAFFSFSESGLQTTSVGSLTPQPPTVTTSAAGVATNGSTTLAAWLEQQFQPQDTTTTTLEGAILAPNASQRVSLSQAVPGLSQPAVATDGTDFLVVWQSDPPNGVPRQLRAIRYSPTQGVLDPSGGFVVAQQSGIVLGGVAYGGGQYMVVWSSPNTGLVTAAAVFADGTVDPMFNVAQTGTAATIGTDGSQFLVAYTVSADSGTQLNGTFVAPQVTPTPVPTPTPTPVKG